MCHILPSQPLHCILRVASLLADSTVGRAWLTAHRQHHRDSHAATQAIASTNTFQKLGATPAAQGTTPDTQDNNAWCPFIAGLAACSNRCRRLKNSPLPLEALTAGASRRPM
jgi:hypothetical protein